MNSDGVFILIESLPVVDPQIQKFTDNSISFSGLERFEIISSFVLPEKETNSKKNEDEQ